MPKRERFHAQSKPFSISGSSKDVAWIVFDSVRDAPVKPEKSYETLKQAQAAVEALEEKT